MTYILGPLPERQPGGAMILIGVALAILLACLAGAPAAMAYPEFQAFTEKSGRTTNCAMCHVNPNGPVGDGEGQIGSLNEGELARLNKARSALEPGQDVDSPILNEFGNHIITSIGKKKFLELIRDPGALVQALGDKSDLDGDGIPDSIEYRDGTDPLNANHGDPWLLFKNSLERNWLDVLLAVTAIACTLYGLASFIRFMNILAERRAAGRQEPADR